MAKKKKVTTHHKGKRHKLPKKPKRPKASASVKSWEAFDERYRHWESKCKMIHDAARKKESLIAKYRHC